MSSPEFYAEALKTLHGIVIGIGIADFLLVLILLLVFFHTRLR